MNSLPILSVQFTAHPGKYFRKHPNVYRQSGQVAKIAVISLPKEIAYPGEKYKKLINIPVIRQMLIYPPLVIQQPMNKRTGQFKRVMQNPIDLVEL